MLSIFVTTSTNRCTLITHTYKHKTIGISWTPTKIVIFQVEHRNNLIKKYGFKWWSGGVSLQNVTWINPSMQFSAFLILCLVWMMWFGWLLQAMTLSSTLNGSQRSVKRPGWKSTVPNPMPWFSILTNTRKGNRITLVLRPTLVSCPSKSWF